ncbi:MAG: DUF3418 domain-containing protein [Burkholderiaceae bacterium]|nr:MAG: DUF3418 domain-containing protein [Burkholderiaceae bacterium]
MTARTQPHAAHRPRNLAVLPAAQRAQWAMQAARAALGDVEDGNDAAAGHRLSNRQYEQLLRRNFINVRRVREWRDIYTQLRTVATEHQWRINERPAGYEALHKALLTGLLGNIGCKLESEDKSQRGSGEFLGARGIKFRVHPGAHLSKKPPRWVVCAELVETTHLFGRGVAQIESQWLEDVGGHLLKKQLLEPHWEKKAGAVMALERATLYGLVVYHGRRTRYGAADPTGAREIFIRQGLMGDDWPEDWPRKFPFLAANRKLIGQIEALEHKSRREDLLVDDALIYAFYDRRLPAGVYDSAALQKWWAATGAARPKLLQLTRDELMRHEAAGITTEAFPPLLRLGGVDCRATYLHAPGDAADGLTVAVPLFALNQVDAERAEWLVPGLLKDKLQHLLKSLPQKVRRHFVPLNESAARWYDELVQPAVFGHGSLLDVALAKARAETGADVHRTDFKLDALPPYLLMNFRVQGEHGRLLGAGRNLSALKAEWGDQARGAFQALAALKPAVKGPLKHAEKHEHDTPVAAVAPTPSKFSGEARYTAWTFDTLPELLEIDRKGQSLIGFPALVDAGDAVVIEVFDEPELAEQKHRAGLRRLFALQMKDALKYAQKNIPDFQSMAVAYRALGTADELAGQIIDVALDRAFLADPLPLDAGQFARRLNEGRTRVALISREAGLLAGAILTEYAQAQRKTRDTKAFPEVTRDVTEQLSRLMAPRFLEVNPWDALEHFPRYLKAIVLRLEKLRADPARDAEHMATVRALDARYARVLAQRKGRTDDVLQRLRWMLEELRVSLFAQALRTPQPVSVKRIEKLWAQVL